MNEGHLYALCRDGQVTFGVARKACVAMNMQLIRVDSKAEGDWIYQTFYAKPGAGKRDGDAMFTGATDNVVEGEWRWLIGGDMFWLGLATGKAQNGLYENWGTAHGMGLPHNQPNNNHDPQGEDCMIIRGPKENEGGKWTDVGCSEENNPSGGATRYAWYTCEQY